MVRAHRFSYEQVNGPIPGGLHCLHRCDNRLCVNPSHLFLGTNRDNISDRVQKGRSNRAPRTEGASHPKATLNADDVRVIRKKWDSGAYKLKQLGAMFGVSKSAIQHIVQRHNWKSVRDE